MQRYTCILLYLHTQSLWSEFHTRFFFVRGKNVSCEVHCSWEGLGGGGDEGLFWLRGAGAWTSSFSIDLTIPWTPPLVPSLPRSRSSSGWTYIETRSQRAHTIRLPRRSVLKWSCPATTGPSCARLWPVFVVLLANPGVITKRPRVATRSIERSVTTVSPVRSLRPRRFHGVPVIESRRTVVTRKSWPASHPWQGVACRQRMCGSTNHRTQTLVGGKWGSPE